MCRPLSSLSISCFRFLVSTVSVVVVPLPPWSPLGCVAERRGTESVLREEGVHEREGGKDTTLSTVHRGRHSLEVFQGVRRDWLCRRREAKPNNMSLLQKLLCLGVVLLCVSLSQGTCHCGCFLYGWVESNRGREGHTDVERFGSFSVAEKMNFGRGCFSCSAAFSRCKLGSRHIPSLSTHVTYLSEE